jgi:hypothetical protein
MVGGSNTETVNPIYRRSRRLNELLETELLQENVNY